MDGCIHLPPIKFETFWNDKHDRKELLERAEMKACEVWQYVDTDWRERCTYYRAIITTINGKWSRLLWVRTHGGFMGQPIVRKEQPKQDAGGMRLHSYQERIVTFCEQHKNAILSVAMGLGKTASLLHYIDRAKPASCLIVAPKRVAENNWKQEAEKWGLGEVADKMCIVKGTPTTRAKAIADTAHPYKVISRDNLKDVQGYKCDLLVIDELTSFKSHDSQRSKAVQSVQAARKIGLTGTFLANGAIDIFGQCKAVGIELMGGNFYAWRAVYFKDALQGSGLQFSKWKLAKPLEEVLQPITDNVFTLSAEDYLQIPPVSEQEHEIQLTQEERDLYDNFSAFLQLEISGEPMSFDEQQKFAKLQTLCNGFVYTTDTNGEQIAVRGKQSTKLEAVADFCEQCKGESEPVLLFYSFREEALWLMEMLKKRGLTYTTPKAKGFIEKWNAGEVDVLMCHPASAGHGLNLQHGGRVIVWSSLTYNYELFAQANARLARQGQTKNVQIHYFSAADTCEAQQMQALRKKDKEQQQFINQTKQ